MNENKNLIFAVVLSALVFWVWNSFFMPKQVIKKGNTEISEKNINLDKKAKEIEKKNLEKKEKLIKKEDKEIVKNSEVNIPESEYIMKTPLFKAIFSNYGGALKKFTLKGKKYVDNKGNNISLIDETESQNYSYNFTLMKDDLMLLKRDAPFKMIEKTDKKIVFQYINNFISITKSFSLTPLDYQMNMDVKIENRKSNSIIFTKTFLISSHKDKNTEKDDPIGQNAKRPFYKEKGEDLEWVDEDDLSEAIREKSLIYTGIDDKYFLSLLKGSKLENSSLKFQKSDNDHTYLFMSSEPINIASNSTQQFSYQIYTGPKVMKNLENLGAQETIDYGFVALISEMILSLLLLIYSFVGNYGFALILLTLIIKALLYIPTKKSYVSMHKMKMLKPELDKLKEKYGDDREKFGRESMALYQKNGVNPLGGCLPMLLQMPIWFGLYRAIQNSVELYNEPFMLWITDLSSKDPYYIFPITMGILMFIQQKLSSASMDQTQAKVMLYTIPVVFTAFMLFLPAGLTIYIWVNTLISILQQKYISLKLEKEEAENSKNKSSKTDKKSTTSSKDSNKNSKNRKNKKSKN